MVIIKIIIASTRPNRFGPQPAKWLFELSKQYNNATFELIDLKEVNLPMLDEPVPAGEAPYTQDHTKRWAATIGPADGFVVVHPEYNHSFPASLKNAFDYLWDEWQYKPICFVSYGGESGGLRALEQLRNLASGMNMFVVNEHVSLMRYKQQFLDKNGTFMPTEHHKKSAHKMIGKLLFWAQQFKQARAQLP